MRTKSLSSTGIGIAVCLLIVHTSLGELSLVDVKQVPVERLVANLERAARKDPKDVRILINLARVHGMAYALKTETAEVTKDSDELCPWFGYLPTLIPFSQVVRTDRVAQQKSARAHLTKAVNRFREAVKLAPDNLPARLGYAWTLDQSGAKTQAIELYRALLSQEWHNERGLTELPMNGETVVTEVAGYLIPLLDKERDGAEIALLRLRVEGLRRLPRPMTPVIVPLKDGLRAQDVEDRNASVTFDADGSGLKQRWTWVTQDAGWLVYDPMGHHGITSGLQLFGNVTFWLFWETGYNALASLDDDGDGVLMGDELKGLAIWHDANGGGVCDPGEVAPLSNYGIMAVSCRFDRDQGHPDRITFSQEGVTFRNGKTRPTYDIILKPSNHRTRIDTRR